MITEGINISAWREQGYEEQKSDEQCRRNKQAPGFHWPNAHRRPMRAKHRFETDQEWPTADPRLISWFHPNSFSSGDKFPATLRESDGGPEQKGGGNDPR